MTIRSGVYGVLIVSVAAFSIARPDVASAQDAEMKDLSTVTCRDVLLASGEDRDGVVLVLHAYLLGEAKQLTYSAEALAEATDRFFDACLDDPGAQALSTMRDEVRKNL